MKLIDPKYGIVIRDGEPVIVKALYPADGGVVAGEAIPEDEPLILFRARDRNALPGALRPYQKECEEEGCCTDFHMYGILNRIMAFENFRRLNPERMRITRGL